MQVRMGSAPIASFAAVRIGAAISQARDRQSARGRLIAELVGYCSPSAAAGTSSSFCSSASAVDFASA